ncbi:MAG: glutathione S-transferase family protein [Acetobacteraceae bacterium]|nr:glutathione S-transferase family protein [Acetobacteraceae bacterium]
MITVYGMSISGNCWKAAQILRCTGRGFRWVEVDANTGETHTAEFLTRNPAGKVPVVELDDGTILTESNAILGYFAEWTPWLPAAGLPRTRVYEWLFFEQYSHEPYVAVARNIISYLRARDSNAERLVRCREGGERAFGVMERRLSSHPWLTDAGPTIADLALFAYTHVADEGEFDLSRWPGVVAWVQRVRMLPGIVPLK